jgi:hypothetical protein
MVACVTGNIEKRRPHPVSRGLGIVHKMVLSLYWAGRRQVPLKAHALPIAARSEAREAPSNATRQVCEGREQCNGRSASF